MSSSLQSIILKLQEFWAAQGCLIGQPYYTQVGAGTMNPSTFLRVLGPEPWKVAYVEPSVRPDDGRYGENPNRFQQHTQFQVILKPDPGNPVELYLQSLEAIGIRAAEHDIRLVEDNWEQPAISAWGLGWEIWLDGQEITQFTYFQQVGGQALEPVSVEITYGLERILINLNNAAAIWEEPWGEGVTYGQVRRQDEFEQSKYAFELADVSRLRQLYDLYKAECEACLAAGMVVPAHDYVLKCSHTFNVLDTRGAIGVTERQAFFGQMREMARRVAETWLEQRKAAEYPLLKASAAAPAGTEAARALPALKTAAPFLLEIGVEELPAADLDSALAQLRLAVPKWLDEQLHLEHGEVQVLGTPRRLVVLVDALAPHQADREDLVKGPPADRAYDKDGKPTPAASGFAAKNGVKPEDLELRDLGAGRYVFALVRQKGRPAAEVLAESLPALIRSLKFEKSMRWNASALTFSRPLRWLVALLGEIVIPFEFAGVLAGNTSRGLRGEYSPALLIPSAGEYARLMRQQGILLEVAERQEKIRTQVKALAETVHGEALLSPELVAEVANLVESPNALLAGFDAAYLALPRDVLTSVMKKHQRYFPIEKNGRLLPNFVVVRNGGKEGQDLVRQGNEHVVRARFADADFFVREDLKHKLEDLRPRLGTLIFQKKLGSMLDKNERIEQLSNTLAGMLKLDADEALYARRAAHLLKADLVSRMVVEMTSLQGIMGGEYARRDGEAPAVAQAIAEQYQPVPPSRAGSCAALADRLDSLVGLFAAGLAPTGTKDPFGLRRAAIGVVQPLIEHDQDFDLAAALQAAARLQPLEAGAEVLRQVAEFITGRLRVVLMDMGFQYDGVDAVLAEQANNPAGAARAVRQLRAWVAREDWSTILPAFARCVRITRDLAESHAVQSARFEQAEEKALFAALEQAEKTARNPGSVDDLLGAFVPMIPAVTAFFEKVLVMAEDPALRANRLGLLQRIAALASGNADLSKLEGF